MSFVLDALKLSEQRRSRFSRPTYAHPPPLRRRSRRGRWIAVLAAAPVLAGVFLAWRLVAPPIPETGLLPEPPAGAEAHVAAESTAFTAPAEAPGQAAIISANDGGSSAQGTQGHAILPEPEAPATLPAEPAVRPALAAPPPHWPALTLQMLFYSPEPGRSFVQINGRNYRAGERLDSGPEVREIAADGVILAHEGASSAPGHGSMKGIHYLDGRRLARAMTAGMLQLQNSREELDRINVFPVADGDTGLNMAHTAQAVILALAESPSRSAGEVAQAASRGALYGARGNSGVILAQFLQGLADAWEGKARLDTLDVAQGLKSAAEAARSGLSNPREGTILSVMSAVGMGALSASPEGELTALLAAAREAADNAVQKTPEQLEVLRRAGVVDAGGAGLAHLLGGIEEFVKTGRGDEAGDLAGAAGALAGVSRVHDLGEESHYRYCTECMISGEGLNPSNIREEIEALGDSVVVAGGARIARLHIHTDRPHEVFAVAHEHGEVSSEKADDMHVQFALLNGSRVPIGGDSGADIPPELVRELRITTTPLRIHLGEKGFLDGLGLPPEALWRAMEDDGEKAQTATPPRGDMERAMSFLAGHFPESVWITLAGKVSGTADVAHSVASELTGGRVRVVDSVNVSIGQGLLIQHAAEWARAGAGADEILAALPSVQEGARIFGVIEDLSHGVRGGRISPRVKQLSDLLKVDALLGIRHGTVKACGVQRRSGDRVKRFARYALKRFPTGQPLRIAVAHANRPESGQRLHQILVENIPNLTSSYITELGAVVSAHAGPGALLAAAIPALPLRPASEVQAD